MIRMYSQGVGRYSQGVALGYDHIGLSARFSHVWDDDLGWLSVRCSIDWGDDLDWLSVRCPIDWGDDPVGLSAQCSIAWDDDSGDVPILFVVPMDGDALHVDWWCACGLKAQSACSPGQRPGCRGWWVIRPEWAEVCVSIHECVALSERS